MRVCPYCGEELHHLAVVRQSIAKEDMTWKMENDIAPAVCCPECYSELDATDLDILGVPSEVIKGVKH